MKVQPAPGITEMNHLNVASASFSAVCFES